MVIPLQPGDSVEDPVDAGQVVLLERGRRVGDIEADDAQNRRFQVVKHCSVSRAATSAPYPGLPPGRLLQGIDLYALRKTSPASLITRGKSRDTAPAHERIPRTSELIASASRC